MSSRKYFIKISSSSEILCLDGSVTRKRLPKSNGFIERFNKIVLDELFRIVFLENFC